MGKVWGQQLRKIINDFSSLTRKQVSKGRNENGRCGEEKNEVRHDIRI